jgi:predicted metal-dependent phosphoesterase TrpH
MMSARPLNVELHCHTACSMDGLMSFDSLLRTAELVGLDALAVTDHDTTAGAFEFQQLAKTSGVSLQIIVGEEKTLADGSHFIGLFLERHIESDQLEGAIREIEEQGGLCLIPHPFRRKDGLFRDGLERLKLFESRVAGFELFSAKCSFAENAKAASLLDTGLTPFGGSDAHYECDLGESINVISWTGDLRTSVQRMFERRAPFQILGKRQREGDGERRYAPLYYRVKKYVGLPKLLVPVAKQCYRRYRNLKFGIGPKPVREIYRHA